MEAKNTTQRRSEMLTRAKAEAQRRYYELRQAGLSHSMALAQLIEEFLKEREEG